MPSFDVVSEANMHEVQNALDQAVRELDQRYDFRGTQIVLKRTDKGFEITSNSEDRAKAAAEVLKEKFVRRKISLKFLHDKESAAAGGQNWRIVIELKKGIDTDNAKKIVAHIKDNKSLKVTASIQGDAVRVSGKKKDDLQEVIAAMRVFELPLELSFNNFRD